MAPRLQENGPDPINTEKTRNVSQDSGVSMSPISNVSFTLGPSDTASLKDLIISTPEEKTDWPACWLMSVFSFLVTISFALFYAGLWPYLNSIDSESDESFLGYVVAVFGVGQGLSSPFLGYWSKKIKKSKPPLYASVILMFLSNVLYFFLPALPQGSRKWLLLLSRLMLGLGAGCVSVLRAYLSASSTSKDRGKVVAMFMAAFSCGTLFGPAIQAALSPIGYPGLVIGPLNFDLYTTAAFCGAILNALMMFLLIFFFKERPMDTTDAEKSPYYALPKYDKLAAIICIFTWFIFLQAFNLTETIITPFIMATYNWDDQQGAEYSSIILTGQAVVSLICIAIYVWKMGAKVDQRILVILGLCGILFFHIVTYPFPFYSDTLDFQLTDLQNQTSFNSSSFYAKSVHLMSSGNQTAYENGHVPHVGCTMHMKWCKTTPRVPLWLFIPAFIILPGISYDAFISVPCATVFSKILGPRKQGTMTGFKVQAGSIARILGPIVVMQLFTNFGPGATWIFQGVLVLVGILPWIIFYKRMVPLKDKNEMKAGDSFIYKRGTFYRF